jgi:hypothetical protein
MVIVGVILAGLLGAACSSGAQQGDDTIAESTLNGAAVSAQAIYSTTLSFAGFNAAKGKQTNPNITWADGGDATANAVSIRGVTPGGLVLVTKGPSGDILCMAVQTTGVTMGTQDAATAADCTGGWPQ